MNGTQVASTASLGNIPTTWNVAATGDFNGDGFGDILWRDGSGNLAVWLMAGTGIPAGTVGASGGLGNVPLTSAIIGAGDFNGDGKTDLLWRDNLGNTSIWFFTSNSTPPIVSSTAGIGNVPTTWSVVGTGDFNGDGYADIVWQDTSGNTAIWLMNGATVLSTGSLGLVPTTTSLALTGDFNGDGVSDLLWRDTSGNTSIWFMSANGTTVTVGSTAAVGNIPTTWSVQNANAE
jgi:FG-GAP-like repeat/FG-GAP repeat